MSRFPPLLSLALQSADLSADTARKAFVGAVAVRRDGALVRARNGSVRLPTCRMPLAHAEARLMRKTGFGATVYVARVKRNGAVGMAKPCFSCMGLLRSKGVELVYYTTEKGWDVSPP